MRRLITILVALGVLLFATPALSTVTLIERAPAKTVIMIHDDIREGDDVTFRKETVGLAKVTLHIIINSPGGRAMQMMDIVYRILELKSEGCHIITESTGTSMSGGAIIFVTGDDRIVHEHTMLMFHKAAVTIRSGAQAPTTEDEANILKILGAINQFMYTQVSKLVGHDIAKKLCLSDTDQFVTGPEALKIGLATTLK